jgi:hypothetical protein
MGNIIDLSDLSRKERRAKERSGKKEARRLRTKGEFVQVAATTIGQFLQLLQWAAIRAQDKDHFQFIGDCCNYQLQCFARAYGWPVHDEESLPIRFELALTYVKEEEKIYYDFSVLGELAEPVCTILSAVNPEMQQVDEEVAPEGEPAE